VAGIASGTLIPIVAGQRQRERELTVKPIGSVWER